MPDRVPERRPGLTCADLEPLQSAWVDGALPAEEAVTLRAHLAACGACRDAVEGLRRTKVLLGSMPVRRLPDRLAIGPASPRTSGSRQAPSAPRLLRVGATAAVTTGLVLGLAFGLGEVPPAGSRVVPVPLDLYAVDHVVHTAGAPVGTPVLMDPAP